MKFDCDNLDDYRMDQGAAEADAASGHTIGIFDRTTRLPGEDLDEQDAAAVLAQLKREQPRVYEIVEQHIERERADAERDVMLHFSSLVQRVFSWCVLPTPCVSKAWGLVYALDLGLHGETPPAEMARKHGLTRAALSCQMQAAAKMLSLAPSRWMRSDSASVNSTAARQKFVATVAA